MKDTLFKLNFRVFFLIICFIMPSLVLADIAVLIHGYHSSGNAWRYNGITRILADNGWNDAGAYTPNGNINYYQQAISNSGKYLITAELPSEAPLEIQASLLSQYLQNISRQFPQQRLHLIGHSVGGLVARLSLVNDYAQVSNQKTAALTNTKQANTKQANTKQANFYTKVEQLITIASPHLGSPIANMADKASDTPIGFFAPLFGADEINRAEQLYKQLGQEDKNHFLFWLNRQPHPPMYYTSIIRSNGSLLKGDWLVPPQSQKYGLCTSNRCGCKKSY